MNNKYTLLFTLSATLLGGSALAIHKSDYESASEREYQRQLAVTESLKSGANWASVGNDNNCDYRLGSTKIQDAINAGHDEIRIVEGTYAENILIDDISVKLFGGYATCADANNNVYDSASVDSIIRPTVGSGLPVVRVEGDSQNNQITFRNLTIRGGEGNFSHSGGGISIKDADVDVIMRALYIRQNTGMSGGGLSVSGGSTYVDMQGVHIANNNGNFNGGGIFCSGPGNNIVFDIGDHYVTSIISNNAWRGGGVAVQDQCHFVSYVGGFLSGIYMNTATGDGGGLRASNGAFVELIGNRRCFPPIGPFPGYCEGNDTEPVDVFSNRADSNDDGDGNGGGIYATGNNTEVRAFNARVNSNRAHDGGAVFVTDGATFTTGIAQDGPGTVSYSCPANGRCNQFKGNKTSESSGGGGAFYGETGGKIEVIGTHIEDNRADTGTAFYLRDAGTDLKLEGSYITGNGSADADGYTDSNALNVFSDASARIDYTTIADNYTSTSSGSIRNYQATVRIYSSIVHDLSGAPALVTGSPVLNSADCVIVNDLGAISGSTNIVDDPEFVDRANGDFHLNAALSPAVDYCDEVLTQHTAQDTDQDDRGWDDYTVTDNLGPFDIGADETYDNDIIFKDGLE